MDRLRKISNIKNVVCMICAVILAGGFIAISSGDGEEDEKVKISSAAADKTQTSSVVTTSVSTAKTRVELSIPELSCSQIEFSDGSVIFAGRDGKYTLIDPDHKPVGAVKITDDNDQTVTLSCYEGNVEIQCNGEKTESFIYNNHVIEISDNLLYLDKSPVQYEDTSFSAYKLSDKYTLECTAVGKYVLRKSDGTTVNSCKITDDSGVKLVINASKNGFEAVNPDDLLEPAVKLNGDLIVTSETKVYINGYELVPPGYNDVFVNTTTTTVTTTTAADSSEDSSSLTDGEDENDSLISSISETPLTPSEPPVNYGSVNTSNADISELTEKMLGYVNEVRKQYGLSEVYGLASLDGAAQTRADELVSAYSHTRPDGTEYTTVLDGAGIGWWSSAENIACGAPGLTDPKEAFDAWLSSEGHRANILDPKMKYMAAAKAETTVDGVTKTYWEQLFINDVYVPG